MMPAPAASFGYFCPCTLWVYKTETQEYTFVGLAGKGHIFQLGDDVKWWFPSVIGQRRYLVRFCRGWCPWDKYAGLPIIQDEW